jgi:hypothetical protein
VDDSAEEIVVAAAGRLPTADFVVVVLVVAEESIIAIQGMLDGTKKLSRVLLPMAISPGFVGAAGRQSMVLCTCKKGGSAGMTQRLTSDALEEDTGACGVLA